MSRRRLLLAQVRALRWVQGRITDQFVKAYIQSEIELLERLGYPVDYNGSELVFPKREVKAKTLKGQLDIVKELEGRTNGQLE